MFPRRYYAARFFTARYWPESEGESPVITDTSLCICGLTFTPMGFDSVSFTPMGFDASFANVNDLAIDFSPPCDC